MMHMPSIPSGSIAPSEAGNASPQLSVRSTATGSETLLANDENEQINLQIFVPELQIQKCLTVTLDEIVWDIKRKLFVSLPQALPQSFNFGLFLPPCDGRAGKFLLEDRPIRDYPFHDCVPYVELKYKKRVYKMLKLDERALKQLHSKGNLKKFMDYVHSRNPEKVEKWCTQGLDPNFHDSQGETPLTVAAGVPNNRDVIIQLVGGGAHLDFRNSEGQTGLHKAAFLSIPENVKTLLELGASPSYRDPIGLTPLYYCMLTTDSQDVVAEMLMSEAADVGVQDMHGNHELHQACKNGLMKHVEHLLYYGADINAQNVNGNTPLHVCAVNNRPECARVLLFRGADPMLVNKQNQTALHVSHIVGNLAVADVIQRHNPHNAVPYRGTPKYNTRRRLGSQILRRRSLSQSSMCSAQSQGYQTPQLMRHSAVPPPAASPSPSIGTLRTAPQSEYGTLRRYPPDAVQPARAGYEPNIPRILVIPRGPKGFGFILRGAKHVDSEVDFEPTPAVPALQFFEGVDMSGMAMKAGLRPGDFLLEINGVDVRRASHEQVVHLIHQSDDTITLKVITIDSGTPSPAQQSHYAAGYGGTVSARSRNHSVPRNGHLPPMPPQRHPATSLSFARGSAFHHSMSYSMDGDQTDSNGASPVASNYSQAPGASSFSNSPTTNSFSSFSSPQGIARLPASKSMDHMPDAGVDAEQLRCASVKSRPSAARRISAAELEHLMIRQGTSASQFQAIPYDQDPVNTHGPKKFTSVAEMKRRKQKQAAINGEGDIYQQHAPLKSFSSVPQDGRIYDASANGNGEVIYGDPRHPRRPSTDSEYSRPARPVLRPKTPPPPPPQMRNGAETIYAPTPQRQSMPAPPPPPPCPPCDYETSQPSSSAKPTSAPPAPPPPPPPDFLKSGGAAKPATPNGTGGPPPPPPLPTGGQTPASKPADANGADCRGISAAALCAVRLKPVGSTERNSSSDDSNTASSNGPASLPPTSNGTSTLRKNVDFDSDLRNALAKRRSKVCHDDDETGRSQSQSPANGVEAAKPAVNATTVGRYGGLSLRESVRENVQTSTKGSSKLLQHSPPTGFVAKKDSGYTSSRTSLEPESECGDEMSHPPPTLAPTTIKIVDPSHMKGADKNAMAASPSPPELLLGSGSSHRVTLISRQLEDTYGSGGAKAAKQLQQDTISVSSTLSNLSSCSRTPVQMTATHNGRTLFLENPSRTPPVDYEDPDSGTGDSDHETTISSNSGASTSVATAPSSVTDVECNTPNGSTGSGGSEYRRKELAAWSINDVADWLSDLNLGEYATTFRSHCITGVQLQRFDRARFTQLGVTRIGHRQSMEASLKDFSKTA